MPKAKDLRSIDSEGLRTVTSKRLRSVDSGELRDRTEVDPEHLCESPGDLGCSGKQKNGLVK